MVNNPDQVALDYVAAGADYLVFPIETVIHSHRLIHAIKEKGAKAGAAINPGTPIHSLEAILPYLDLINVMSVNPGFGGQKFIPTTLDKLRQVRERIDASGKAIRLEVDGGVGPENIRDIAAAGADTFVAGSAIFKQDDYAQVIRAMRQAIV